jgi:hypothetical protein
MKIVENLLNELQAVKTENLTIKNQLEERTRDFKDLRNNHEKLIAYQG